MLEEWIIEYEIVEHDFSSNYYVYQIESKNLKYWTCSITDIKSFSKEIVI